MTRHSVNSSVVFLLFSIFCIFSSIHVASSQNNNCFAIGAEYTYYPGFINVTLDMLTTSLTQTFISQYSSGFNYLSDDLDVYNCLITFGTQCLYANNNTKDTILAYTFSGGAQCVWQAPVGPVKLGTLLKTFYPTITTSDITSWIPRSCDTLSVHYAMLYNTSCGIPTASPSTGVSCCYYYSHSSQYETFFCQRPGYDCPVVPGYAYVANETATDCSSCTIERAKKYSILSGVRE